MDKIEGATLLGFDDFFDEGDLVGAPAKRAAAARPKAPVRAASAGRPGGQKTIYGPAKPIKHNPAVQASGATLRRARSTAGRAVNAAAKALQSATKKPALPVGKPKTALGAAAATAAKTPKQQAAVARAQGAAQKAAVAQKAVAAAGLAAKNAAIDLAKKVKSQKSVALALKKPKGSTRVRGALIGALKEYYDSVGAAPDPNNPGFLNDGSPDPAYDPNLTDPALSEADLSAMDASVEAELPPPPPMDVVIPDMVAAGGIPYDGSRGKKPGWIGSYSYFFQTIVNPRYAERRYGFVHGGDPHNSEWPGDKYDQWVWVHGKKGDSGSIPDFPGQEPGVSGWWDDAAQINRAYLEDANVAKASVAKGYGPIIGNPAWEDTKGLRMDAKGNLFWLPQEAPEWATAALRQAEAVTAQAEKKAADAAAKAEQAVLAKQQADAAAAQAQQDAQNALAESAAASQAAVAEQQQQTQAQQLELDQAKADQAQMAVDAQAEAEERKFLLEQARADAEIQRQERQYYLEQQRIQQERLAQMPDGGEYAPEEYGEPEDDGGGEYYEGEE